MIDWLTLRIDGTRVDPASRATLQGRAGRVIKLSAEGEIEWQTVARESIRSDSHQVTVCMGSDLMVCGSPARVTGTSNVFGSGDIRECARGMLGFVERQAGVRLPPMELWRTTRVDVTHNYDLGSLPNVRQALMALRHAEGGRYQVRTAAESVYWSTGSRYRSGKAYAKGPHLLYMQRRGTVHVTDAEVEIANRLLRLEVSLRSEWWKKVATKPWHEYTEAELDELHESYFGPLIGNCEVVEMSNERERCVEAARAMGRTVGQGQAAYAYWCLIRSIGFERARELTSRPTHYRHVQVLRAAGLSWADFQAGRVVQLRRTPLVLAQPVRSWAELRAVA